MRTYALTALTTFVMAQELANETNIPKATYGGLSSEGITGEYKVTVDGTTWYGWWAGFETTWADSVFASGTWVSNYVGEASKTMEGTYDYVTCNVSYIPDGQPATADRVVIEVYEGQPKWDAATDAIDQVNKQNIPRPTGASPDQEFYVADSDEDREETYGSTANTASSPPSSSQRCSMASMPYWCEGDTEDCNVYKEMLNTMLAEYGEDMTMEQMMEEHEMSSEVMTGFRIYLSGATGNATFGADAENFTYTAYDWGFDFSGEGGSGAATLLASATAVAAILVF